MTPGISAALQISTDLPMVESIAQICAVLQENSLLAKFFGRNRPALNSNQISMGNRCQAVVRSRPIILQLYNFGIPSHRRQASARGGRAGSGDGPWPAPLEFAPKSP